MEVTNTSGFSQEVEMPKNNMTLAIIATVLGLCSFYCTGLILGIIAIVMSSQVKSKFENGDVEGALKSAKTSKLLSLIAIGLFVLGIAVSAYSIMTYGLDNIIEEYKEILEQAQAGN
ncbi:CD225/dispanin family protein [Myroides guanonis]|uniref:Interferon-induced transmembrane protein n=1 Tax=Myroides guanonis TaxID=1150112 RepID=A0A1I3SMC5_9FLAO|nr:CD225/dispanin family protein [Myroides guanonis]SFJ59875.1 Interferon-induced transmembrane protein [Myroides guanonis]